MTTYSLVPGFRWETNREGKQYERREHAALLKLRARPAPGAVIWGSDNLMGGAISFKFRMHASRFRFPCKLLVAYRIRRECFYPFTSPQFTPAKGDNNSDYPTSSFVNDRNTSLVNFGVFFLHCGHFGEGGCSVVPITREAAPRLDLRVERPLRSVVLQLWS